MATKTRIAASGEDPLASVAAASLDLILLDIMMPGVDGYQVASVLKSAAATIAPRFLSNPVGSSTHPAPLN